MAEFLTGNQGSQAAACLQPGMSCTVKYGDEERSDAVRDRAADGSSAIMGNMFVPELLF